MTVKFEQIILCQLSEVDYFTVSGDDQIMCVLKSGEEIEVGADMRIENGCVIDLNNY